MVVGMSVGIVNTPAIIARVARSVRRLSRSCACTGKAIKRPQPKARLMAVPINVLAQRT